MPYLKIQTNLPLEETKTAEILRDGSARCATLLDKPEEYVMVALETLPMSFGGTTEPTAYIELKSIDLPEDALPDLSRELCRLLQERRGISPERIYIEFSDIEAQRWGWNGETF